MINKIVAFQTTDGSLYPTLPEAERYEAFAAIDGALSASPIVCIFCNRNVSILKFTDWIDNNLDLVAEYVRACEAVTIAEKHKEMI